MRMWRVHPAWLCRRHLLGAHVETHMAVGSILRNKHLGRFISDGLIETAAILHEHDALAAEMRRRGYRHASPMQYLDTLGLGQVDSAANRRELIRRCPECRERILGGTT